MGTTVARPDPKEAPTPARPPDAAVWSSGLSLRLDDREILSNICLNVPRGQTVAILGANGAGKSTLLRVLALLAPRSAGELELFGQAVTPGATGIRLRIGVIAHQPMLYCDLSARENLLFFGQLYDVADAKGRSDEMLELVGLSHRADDAVKKLSRGMTQRVSIARALMHNPDLLLADEPFDGLDAPSVGVMETLLGRLSEAGKTVMLVNHNVPQSLRLADTVIVLRQGRVALTGPADESGQEAVLKEMAGV